MTNTRIAQKAGRQLILIDIENLTATPSPSSDEVATVLACVREAVPGFDDAQWIVACSHHAAPAVAFEIPAARHLWRSGPDGADLALLDVLENESVHERYERVTICSGDGIFASSAAWLARAYVDVRVVSLPGHLSARLRLASRHVSFLPAGSLDAVEGASG